MKNLKKQNFIKLLLLFIIITLFCSSCKIMYKPNMVNVPLFKEKGEIQANIGVKNFQGAYAITENVGVMLNGYYDKGGWTASTDDTTYGTSTVQYTTIRSLLEGGAGYFKTISDNIVAEAYAGGGLGKSTWDISGYENGVAVGNPSIYSANYLKIFAQPSIGLTQDIVDFIFSTRFVVLKFSNIETNYTFAQLEIEQINGIEIPTYLFLEPVLTFRIGYKWIKFQMQVGYSAKLSSEPLNSKNSIFNTSLHFDIAKRFNK